MTCGKAKENKHHLFSSWHIEVLQDEQGDVLCFRHDWSVLTQTLFLPRTLEKPRSASFLKCVPADFLQGIFMFMTKINKLPAIKQWKRAGRGPVQRGPAA